MESAPVGLGIALAQWSGRVRQAPWGKQAPSQAPRRKVLSLGLAHYPRGPSRGGKKGRVSSAPEAPCPPHLQPSLWASSR